VVASLLLRTGARVDDEHQDDADNDGDEGGPQVVGDGQDTQTPAGLGVHGGQARHKAAMGRLGWLEWLLNPLLKGSVFALRWTPGSV